MAVESETIQQSPSAARSASKIRNPFGRVTEIRLPFPAGPRAHSSAIHLFRVTTSGPVIRAALKLPTASLAERLASCRDSIVSRRVDTLLGFFSLSRFARGGRDAEPGLELDRSRSAVNRRRFGGKYYYLTTPIVLRSGLGVIRRARRARGPSFQDSLIFHEALGAAVGLGDGILGMNVTARIAETAIRISEISSGSIDSVPHDLGIPRAPVTPTSSFSHRSALYLEPFRVPAMSVPFVAKILCISIAVLLGTWLSRGFSPRAARFVRSFTGPL